MEIRFFDRKDIESVADVLHDMSRHYNGDNASPRNVIYRNLVDNILGPDSGVRIVVALVDQRVVAVAMISVLYPAPKERAQLFMKELYVRSEWRSRGVGEQLMRWIAEYAVAHNCVRFDWTVDAENTGAVEFYQRLGATNVTNKLYFRFADDQLQRFSRQ
jgi:GNAT superfamily N-acetyltransferase